MGVSVMIFIALFLTLFVFGKNLYKRVKYENLMYEMEKEMRKNWKNGWL